MTKRILHCGRMLRRQDGISLVMAIGILGVLSLAGSSAVYFANANQRSAVFSKENASAYDLAEAGVNEMLAVLARPENNALNPSLLPATTRTYDAGTVTWQGTLDIAAATWSVTSTGRIQNPTGAAKEVTRTLKAQVPVTASLAQPVNTPLWNYMIALRTGNACDMRLESSVNIISPLYVVGNLCLDSSSKVTGGPLVIGDQLKLLTSSNAVGSSSKPVNEVHVRNGCRYMSNAVQNPCRNGAAPSNSNVWATTLTNTPPVIEIPTVDWNGWYENAMPGPRMNCSSASGERSGTAPVFENETINATRNNSVPGVFNLTPLTSYTCRVGPASNPLGELSYNASTRTLTVRGAIFIDGSATVSTSQTVNYNGQATLYLSGTFLMNGSAQLCSGVASGQCDFPTWNPNNEMLTIVANGSGTSGSEVGLGNSIALKSSTKFQGALFASNAIWIDSSAQTQGPMIGSTLYITSSVQSNTWPAITMGPHGMPGTPQVYAQPNAPRLYSG